MPRGRSIQENAEAADKKARATKATVEKALIAEQVIARAEMRGEKLAKGHFK